MPMGLVQLINHCGNVFNRNDYNTITCPPLYMCCGPQIKTQLLDCHACNIFVALLNIEL